MRIWYITFLAVVLVACTDYVSKIEDERDDWRSAQELVESSSSEIFDSGSSAKEISSSSGKKTNSSSSAKTSNSSSSVILGDDEREGSNSSDIKSSSSEKDISSSSSMKEGFSSSSEDEKSSSSKKTSWAYLNPAISYGEITDERDGQVYKTIVIGRQTWMAENLNYKVNDSYCYDGADSNCVKYGLLYTLDAATDACPSGWRLPTKIEFDTLITATDNQSNAGEILKTVSGWEECVGCSGNGTDDYGFSAMPAGYYSYENGYHAQGLSATFWSTTHRNGSNVIVYCLSMNNSNRGASVGEQSKTSRFSVRCLKEENVLPKSSSSISSSSSKASWAYLNPAISYGEMTDDRDGQVYKTVVIGEQTWMAENLNYKVNRTCSNNDTDNCKLYGGLYIWNDAKTICPSGWHLPSKEEYEEVVAVAGDSTNAGKILKSRTEWKDDGNGSDSLGFSGIPVGSYVTYNTQQIGVHADFWTTTQCPGYYGSGAYTFGFRYDRDNSFFSCSDLKDNYSNHYIPVRCVKD